MSEKYTQLVYQSDKINFQFKDDVKRVISTKQIKKGELILIEHKICGLYSTLIKWLTVDKTSRDELYPRKNHDLTDLQKAFPTRSEKQLKIINKIVKNCFSSDNDEKPSIGLYISWFNTSPNFNAGTITDMLCKEYVDKLYDDLSFSIVFATIDIQPEEEIFIYYERSSEGFTPSGEENDKIMKEYMRLTDEMYKDVRKTYNPMITDYLVTQECLDVYISTIKLKYGKEINELEVLKSKVTGEYFNSLEQVIENVRERGGFLKEISGIYQRIISI